MHIVHHSMYLLRFGFNLTINLFAKNEVVASAWQCPSKKLLYFPFDFWPLVEKVVCLLPSYILHLMGWLVVHNHKTQEMQDTGMQDTGHSLVGLDNNLRLKISRKGTTCLSKTFVKNPSSGVCMVVSQPKTVVFPFRPSTAWGEGGVPSFILHLMGCLAVHNNKTQEMQDIARYSLDSPTKSSLYC